MPYKDPIRQRREQARLVREAKVRKTEWLLEYKSRGCEVCGEKAPECLDFHHRDPQQKIRGIAWMRGNGTAFNVMQAEVAKCFLLCANCHRKVHAGTLTL